MKAMILAAGQGTRLRPLSYDLPKPMIPVLGKPVMAYLVEHLARHGVTDIMVNVSHLHEKIEEYFGDGQRFGVQIGYSFEGYTDANGETVPVPLGSAGGMKKIQQTGGFFDETTLVLCGDAIIDLDLGAALEEHRSKGAIASVIAKEVPWSKVSSYGIVVADEQGRVASFQEKPSPIRAKSNLASTGIYLMEPEVLDLIPPGTKFDIGSDLFPLLVKQCFPFFAQRRGYNWIDIGSVSDYWQVLQGVLAGDVAQMDMPGTQIAEGLWVGLNTSIDWQGSTIEGPVFIGSGTRIEAGVTIIGPSWIGHGSHLCRGARLERCVLFEYTRILPGVSLHEMIVFKEYCVDRSGDMKHTSANAREEWGNARDRRALRRAEILRK